MMSKFLELDRTDALQNGGGMSIAELSKALAELQLVQKVKT